MKQNTTTTTTSYNLGLNIAPELLGTDTWALVTKAQEKAMERNSIAGNQASTYSQVQTANTGLSEAVKEANEAILKTWYDLIAKHDSPVMAAIHNAVVPVLYVSTKKNLCNVSFEGAHTIDLFKLNPQDAAAHDWKDRIEVFAKDFCTAQIKSLGLPGKFQMVIDGQAVSGNQLEKRLQYVLDGIITGYTARRRDTAYIMAAMCKRTRAYTLKVADIKQVVTFILEAINRIVTGADYMVEAPKDKEEKANKEEAPKTEKKAPAKKTTKKAKKEEAKEEESK